ncbi:MAG: glycosyltransferase family 4 protein, partial [Candidatus Omnitrophica bacterium]|nr:glycosyltransferase family 4 protein [Candidatus Omnitrophota bacterium]
FYTWDWLLARNLAILSHIRKIDFVMEVNGLHSFESEIRGYFKQDSFWNRHYISRGERLVCRKASMLVTVSEGFRQTIHQRYEIPLEKIVVAPNGADLDQFPYSPKTWESGAPFVIGWAGTFQPYEGFETFIDLAEMFRGKGEDIRFLIVGDGPARPEYERAIQKRGLGEAFDFRGKVDWREVPDILAQAHCCILVPTLSEAGKAYRDAIGMTQMKFYEYLALGKPVITYRLGDAEDLVEKNGAGITCSPTVEDLAEAILKLKGGDLEAMARSARTLAEDRFTWEKTAESIHEGLLNRFSDSD